MHGFIAIIAKETENKHSQVVWKDTFSFQEEHVKRTLSGEDFYIEQFTSVLFLKDKIFLDTADFLFLNEGLILNLKKLLFLHSAKDISDLISKLYLRNQDFFKDFEGNFAGLFMGKTQVLALLGTIKILFL